MAGSFTIFHSMPWDSSPSEFTGMRHEHEAGAGRKGTGHGTTAPIWEKAGEGVPTNKASTDRGNKLEPAVKIHQILSFPGRLLLVASLGALDCAKQVLVACVRSVRPRSSVTKPPVVD